MLQAGELTLPDAAVRGEPRRRARRGESDQCQVAADAAGWDGPAVLTYLPATRHTYLSAVNITRLPAHATGHLASGDIRVPIKDGRGDLLESAIPRVTIVKDGNYTVDDWDDDPSREVDLLAQIARNLAAYPLAGFVVEGLSAAQAADISERYDRVLHFRRATDIVRLVERLCELMPESERPRRVLVLLRDRRISVLGGYLYGVDRRYLYEEGRLRELPVRGPAV